MTKKLPHYRFQGYTDAWELRKLGEVVYRSNLTSSSKDLPRLEFEDINSGLGTLNKDISQKVDDRKGLEFNEGDVLFGKLRPYLKNWWYAEFKGIALGDFWNLKSDLWHSCFLYTYIQSNSFQLVANDTSGTKMPRSDWNLVAESIAKFPSLPEQEAIGTFFSTLDRHITLHQRKLDTLKEQKKSYLKLLFPAKGQTKPALRFQGFEDDWEEVKLGELCDIRTGKLDANAMVENGEYDFYTSGIKKYRIDVAEFEGPAITIAGNGATVGYMHLADGKFNAYQRTYVLTNFKVDRRYIFSEIAKKLPIKIQQEARTGNIPYIVLSMLTELSISLPSLPEQEAIGTFFQTLDQEISQVEDKLASLKEMKKTLLRKLFV
ncbi:restriction endonuclease subunit S [Streptococcus suis]|uniref:restriction endonuclease subunit S n=1 Tax=Streptococcus suis TaxID=1307 RepID=UPI001559117C|nr:restriction endonuclease subunit S [Streptococcus suis]